LAWPSQFSISTYFARHTGNFRCKATQLIHHGIDGVLQFEDFSFYIHADFPGEVTICNGSGYFGNVSHL
jgi:hypothetical protein